MGQPGAGDPRVHQVEVGEVGQPFEVFQSGIRHLRRIQVKLGEADHSLELGQAVVGHRAIMPKVKPVEVAKTLEMRESVVAQLGVTPKGDIVESCVLEG